MLCVFNKYARIIWIQLNLMCGIDFCGAIASGLILSTTLLAHRTLWLEFDLIRWVKFNRFMPLIKSNPSLMHHWGVDRKLVNKFHDCWHDYKLTRSNRDFHIEFRPPPTIPRKNHFWRTHFCVAFETEFRHFQRTNSHNGIACERHILTLHHEHEQLKAFPHHRPSDFLLLFIITGIILASVWTF